MKTGFSARRESIQHLASLSCKLLLAMRNYAINATLVCYFSNWVTMLMKFVCVSLLAFSPAGHILLRKTGQPLPIWLPDCKTSFFTTPELLSVPQLRKCSPIMTTRTQSSTLCATSSAFQTDRPAPSRRSE